MTRTAHHPHPTPGFPVYCLDWADDETLLLGGGGGASRSGIENKLKLCKVSKDGRKVKCVNELALSKDEDAPMTMAVDRSTKVLVTGINASSSAIQGGSNDHCRTYSYEDEKLALVKGAKTISAAWSDDYPYQKLTTLSPSGSLLAIGTTDDFVSILKFPSLESLSTFKASEDGELVDLCWGGADGDWLAVTTTSAIHLYQVTLNEKVEVKLLQSIYPPSLDLSPVAFRAARFSPSNLTSPKIHAILNATKVVKRGAPRKAFVCTFGIVSPPSTSPLTPAEKESASKTGGKGKEAEELGKWDVLVRREVAGKPVTVFDVSSDGKLLSYGCSDLSVGILDSMTLAPLLKILQAHSFPPTALRFNPAGNLLVSASADNTIRVVVVPASFSGISISLVAFILAILAILLTLFFRR